MDENANNAVPPTPGSPAAASVSENSGRDTVRSNSGPAHSSQSSAAKSQSGTSPFKTIIPILLMVGVVFGITFISQYAPKKKEESKRKTEEVYDKKVLTFGQSIRVWNPQSFDLPDQIFPGFYEGGPTEYPASFWLENRHAAPVTMQLSTIATGCSKCSSGRFAPIPPEVMDQLFLTTVLSGLPQGLTSGLPLGVAATSANLDPARMNWQYHKHSEMAHPQYTIPAAPGSAHLFPYQWGIFELLFKVEGKGKPLAASYDLKVEGTSLVESATLQVIFEGVDAFDVSPQSIDIGNWSETSDPRTFNIVVYSLTRGPNRKGPYDSGNLEPPSVDVRMPGGIRDLGGFITVGPAVRISEPSELGKLMVKLSNAQKKPLKIESAYEFTVTVNPKVGGERMDLGLLERDVLFALPGMKEPKTVRLKGMVTGDLELANHRTDIELPSYRVSTGITFPVSVIAKHKDAVVTLVPDECRPKFVNYKLTKVNRDENQGYYELSVEIPKDGQAGSWSGVVVLELKGSRPQRIRIPIRGTGKF